MEDGPLEIQAQKQTTPSHVFSLISQETKSQIEDKRQNETGRKVSN